MTKFATVSLLCVLGLSLAVGPAESNAEDYTGLKPFSPVLKLENSAFYKKDGSFNQDVAKKAYYDMMIAKGLKHHAAVRTLAFKWIRILYRCWKNRTLYNEAHYFRHLYTKRSPLLKFMASKS